MMQAARRQPLAALGLLVLVLDRALLPLLASPSEPAPGAGLQARLLDKCCQVGRERAAESARFACKLSAREALVGSEAQAGARVGAAQLLALSADSLLSREPSFVDQCEMVLESCCLALHRTRNCDSGKQFAKSGTSCMDVELSKEATVATESFNDCCMSCSLGILAARSSAQNESSGSTRAQQDRCKLISPLASSLSGQLYEQTYTECCQENLPRHSSALHEPGAPIDCSQANSCSQRCLPIGSLDPITRRPVEQDRCDCFTGFRLAPDEISCLDVDECKLNLHTCNKQSEICDNTRGSFRCLARSSQSQVQGQRSGQHQHHFNFRQSHSHHSHHSHHSQHQQHHQHQQTSTEPAGSELADSSERQFASLRLRPPSLARW